MAKAFNQKMKILYLIQMLMQNTDSEHVLNMQEIIAALDEKGIKSERKSIYDDFETIRQFGIGVRFKKSQPSGYYIETRELDLPEVQMIVKAIRNSKEIAPEKLEVLIEKLSRPLSIYQAEQLRKEAEEATAENEALAGTGASMKSSVSAAGISGTIQVQDVQGKEEIQLLFKEKHTEAVKKQFGEDINIKQHKESIYKVKVMTEVDSQFFGWVSSHGMGIKIVKPKNVAEDYRIYLKKLLKQYK